MNKKIILEELSAASNILEKFMRDESNIEKIEKSALLISDGFEKGNKVISCGNGGSHCDAMHFAEELTGRYRKDRKALPAIAISDPSHISCVANDFGYEYVFSRYLEGLGKKGDTLLGISTSGNSKNIVEAVKVAKKLQMKSIILTGTDGGELASMGDIVITVPHNGYADRIQEIHIKIIHILILLVEKHQFDRK